MSYDFDMSLAPCDHRVHRERLRVEGKDLRRCVAFDDPLLPLKSLVNIQSSIELYISGKKVERTHNTYGWTTYNMLVDDGIEPRIGIEFLNAFRHRGLILEASYLTSAPFCNRCVGTGLELDFKPNVNNRFERVTGHDKLIQRVMKLLMTTTCPFYPLLTSKLKNSIGGKFSNTLFEEDIKTAVVATLSNLIKIQATQKTVQDLSPQEIMRKVEDVHVQTSSENPNKVTLNILISSYGSNEPIPLSLNL